MAPMTWFDAHNHLQDPRLEPGLPDVIRRARNAGVSFMSCCGTEAPDWPRVERLAAEVPGLIPSFGIHPWNLRGRGDRWLEDLESVIKRVPSAGVGEIGLDHALEYRCDDEQDEVFGRQLELARRFERPVSIHCRKAWESLLQGLDRVGPLPAGFVVHAYSGSPEMVPAICERGGYVSFSGTLTRHRNHRAQAACMVVPEDRLLIETDAPDMLPEIPGRQPAPDEPPNEPANLAYVAAAMAQYRAMPLEMVAGLTTDNARRLFRVRE